MTLLTTANTSVGWLSADTRAAMEGFGERSGQALRMVALLAE
jgi:hypothetical protein